MTTQSSTSHPSAAADLATTPDTACANAAFDEDAFRVKLITAQYQLRESVQVRRPRGVVVLVNGIETAGKGAAVTRLREWVDPRLLKLSYLPTKYPSKREPIWQRHAKPLPRHGEITVMFGSWYADLIYAYVKGKLSKNALSRHITHILEFEQDLCANDTHVVKCWFDISDKTLKKRLSDNQADADHLYKLDWDNTAHVDTVRELKEILNDATASHPHLQWQAIDGEDTDIACQHFAQAVLTGLQASPYERTPAKRPYPPSAIPAVLLNPSSDSLKKSTYKNKLKKLQTAFAELVREHKKHNIILLFEGMDAAGKGGAIRRLVSPLDPREYSIHNIGAPEPEELQHPYLWRFWHRLPEQGGLVIFDRSWYGRVLVERVEAFSSHAAWQEAYAEINRFEQHLTDTGTVLLKFWLAIDSDVQLERFKARQNTPHKRFKITPDDWRNRERWEDYVQSAADMLEKTNPDTAPWHVIATNDKASARIAVLEACVSRLKQMHETTGRKKKQ